MSGPDAADGPSSMGEAMAQMLEGLAPLREAMTGYRRQLEADGWSPTVAEQMAAEVHDQMIGMMFAQQGRRP